ncbi:hemolysin family protein [Corynebacterium sp. TAE3-ERU12]|uniref:hemolysin family protein n=1 Tax=Corynebacterium sp. TAE3-ERU12 TaxID=2849491 RepID=UPI001C4481D1|nr:hemolysin family protein [Corynebacterium sp. TAE3-ERU12]MBV7295506.1 hemolysin family protein [Corynebacterium sp. TAE3-ERU12]
MNDYFGLFLTAFLLLLNAFFVGAEFALIAARRDRLEALAAQGKKRARTVIQASENLSLMLAAAQLGITIASLLLGKVSEPAIAHLLEKPFHAAHLPDNLLHPVSFAIALGLISILHILLGEMVPKNIALAGPETTAMWLTPIHVVFYKLTKPLLLFFNWVARHTLAWFGIEQKDELDSSVDSSELASMIAESRSEGLLDADEHSRLNRALSSESRSIAEVLVPLEQVRTVPAHPRVGDLEEAVTDTGFSRFPVIDEAGSYQGYIHVKDVLDRVINPESGPEEAIPDEEIRTLISVDADGSIDKSMRILRRKSQHMALATKDGKPVGIVTLEDLIEEHIGVVRDWTHETVGHAQVDLGPVRPGRNQTR